MAARVPFPPQLQHLGLGPQVVEASAGTGKTYLLEHLFVDLILRRGARAEEILVVTFTEKATAELTLRIRALVERLAQAASLAESPACEEANSWILDEPAKDQLTQVLRDFDRVTIATLHGFCQRVLREYAFVQGRLWEESLSSGPGRFQTAFREILREKLAWDQPAQKLLSLWLDSGKDVDQLGEFLGECHEKMPVEIRPIFDEGRLSQAVRALATVDLEAEDLAQALKQATVHGQTIKAKLRRLEALKTLLPSVPNDPLAIAFAPGLCGLLDDLMAKVPWDQLPAKPLAFGQALIALREAFCPLEAALVPSFLPAIQARLQERQRNTGEMGYTDLLTLVEAAIADEGAAGAALRNNLQKRYRHALIDEFQDTDPVSWSIFRRLFFCQEKGRSLTVIGDPKQAIYGFRGADVHTYLAARDTIVRTSGPPLQLTENYRSTPALVNAYNRLFDQAASFFRPEGGITYDHPVTAARTGATLSSVLGAPTPPVVVLDLQDDPPTLNAEGLRTRLRKAIVAEMAGLVRGEVLRDGRPFAPSDIFVVTLTNAESLAMGQTLAEAGIPFAYYASESVLQSVEAEHLLAILRSFARPEDPSLRAQALLTPFFHRTLEEIAFPATPTATQLFYLLATRARMEAPARFLAMCLNETGVLRRARVAPQGEQAITNYLHLVELLQAECAKRHPGFSELVETFAAWIMGLGDLPDEDTRTQRLSTEKSAVQILTAHKSKGLEADVVFLYSGRAKEVPQALYCYHEGPTRMAHIPPLSPSANARYSAEKADEDARLLYVALTRARYRLYLPHFPSQATLVGALAVLNDRLTAMLGDPRDDFQRVPLRTDTPAFPVPPLTIDVPSLGEELPDLAPILPPERRGFIVTSYSSMKRSPGGFVPVEEPTFGDDEIQEPLETSDLPPGPETGIFLHRLLEVMPIATLAGLPARLDLESVPELYALAVQECARLGRPREHASPALRLVDRALRGSLVLGDEAIPGMVWTRNLLREVEFLFPIPEPHHALWTLPEGNGFRIDRGLVKGFIDLVFEHADRVYLCDWKSDLLRSFDPPTLAEHVRRHYDIQIRIYTLATLRWLGIRDAVAYETRMGGILYSFLRGLDPGDPRQGVYFRKPAWAEILAWEGDLLHHDFGRVR